MVVPGLRLEALMSATILNFQPKSRSGDPDFPGIAVLAVHYKAPAKPADDLAMDHADTAPSEYCAPDSDGA